MPAPACIPTAVFGHRVDHVPADDEDVAETATTRAVIPHLYACIAALPERRQREVLVRHYGLAGARPRGMREIAAELGVSVGTVHASEQRALELLRETF